MKIVALLSLFSLAACGPIVLVHPGTGERITCNARGDLAYTAIQNSGCARQYESLGFIRAEDLTPEQRATIKSKPLPLELQQDITIRSAPAKTP